MATKTPTKRLLRTRDEIRAAGRAHGKTLAPLTEEQVNRLAVIVAPAFRVDGTPERGAA